MLVCVCGIYFLLDLHFLKIITVYSCAENIAADSDAFLIKTALLRVVFIKTSGQGDSSRQRMIKKYQYVGF